MKTGFPKGFTLIEILIVVMILGLIAAVVIVSINNVSTEARQTSFITNIRSFATAAEYYHSNTGEYLADADAGVVPTGWEEYIEVRKWVKETPIGGHWDIDDQDTCGFTSCVGVDFDGTGQIQNDAFMQQVDSKCDDGDLNTGSFRKIADGQYYYILAM